MRYRTQARSFVALLMAAFMLATPLTALAKKGEKNFKKGLEHEQAQQWEKAAQEFALAVAARPSDTEYQLHYRRAIFNASQVFMQKGRTLAEQGDYIGAYNAFRTAYGYDSVNELATNEMQRMLRLQREKEGLSNDAKDAARISPTSYRRGANGTGANGTGPKGRAADAPNPRIEQLKNVNYSGELEPFIRQLADELNINVIFDQNFSQVKRTINLRLKDITAARTLDYVFQAYGLFFQRLDRRTILVADQSKRPIYQQLVLRTFYLNNIPTDEARQMIQAALPANAGRQPQVVMNKTTNSITVRDTPENMRIIADLIQGIDKDRAEVVMEVSIYEVTRTDLLQVGNQLGSADTLSNLGGLQTGSVLSNGARALGAAIPISSGVGVLIPSSSLSLLQGKNNTRLVFSTQVHAFDDEKSETRIGSKVPVQTASVYNSFGTAPNNGNNGSNAAANSVFGSNGFPVIQYEDTGLVLDFTPKVYPNQDVQVKMNIETKDVGAGPDPLTPTFSQRKISGVARIPNGKTMMIASVGQDRQSNGKTGLPLLGLIPILGRMFTAPRRDNTQSDVVITMTPRVLRAPMITPEDEEEKKSGSMQMPTQESLEAVIRDAEREEQLARAVMEGRNLPTNQAVQFPAQPGEEVAYVPAPKALAEATTAAPESSAPATTNARLNETSSAQATPVALNLAPSAAGPLVISPSNAEEPPLPPGTAKATSASTGAAALTGAASAVAPPESTAELLLLPDQHQAKAGEKRRVMVFMKTDAPVGLATATLRFDPKVLAVRAVSQGLLTSDKATMPTLTQSIDPSGVLVFSVAPAAGAAPLTGEGLLLIIEVETLAAGEGSLLFDANKVHLIATDGRTVRAKVTESRINVTQ